MHRGTVRRRVHAGRSRGSGRSAGGHAAGERGRGARTAACRTRGPAGSCRTARSRTASRSRGRVARRQTPAVARGEVIPGAAHPARTLRPAFWVRHPANRNTHKLQIFCQQHNFFLSFFLFVFDSPPPPANFLCHCLRQKMSSCIQGSRISLGKMVQRTLQLAPWGWACEVRPGSLQPSWAPARGVPPPRTCLLAACRNLLLSTTRNNSISLYKSQNKIISSMQFPVFAELLSKSRLTVFVCPKGMRNTGQTWIVNVQSLEKAKSIRQR